MARSAPSRSTLVPSIENLEDRTVMTASTQPTPLFAFYGTIASTSDRARFTFQVDTSHLNFDNDGKVRLVFQATRTDGSQVDPDSLRFYSANKKNTPVTGESRKDFNGRSASAAAVKFKPGTYEVEVRSERHTTGAFTLQAFLLGDANNDNVVNTTDLALIKGLLGKRSSDIAYNPAVDVNLSGRIDAQDYLWAKNNLGSAYRSQSALQFDGVDDYAVIPVQGALNSIFDNQRFTIESWIQVNNWYGDAWFSVVDGEQWTIQINKDNGLEFTSWAGGTTSFGFVPEVGVRYHIAVNYDQVRGSVILYVDGQLYGERELSAPLESTSHLLLGVNPFGALEYSSGLIDDFRIWSTNRTATEIQDNYNKQLKGNEAGLVGYWNFNEGQGNVFFDRSASKAHGKLATQRTSQPRWAPGLVT